MNRHKKTSKLRRRHWLRQVGIGAVAIVAMGVVILAVLGMAKGSGSQSTARRSEITPVVVEEGTPIAPRTGGPAMSFDVTSVDFGDVPLDTTVSYAFPFANTGDATLQVEDVQVKTLEGCWPFQPVVGTTTLKPGEKSDISFSTMMHEGMEGPHLFEIAVKSNDPQQPERKLLVKANFG